MALRKEINRSLNRLIDFISPKREKYLNEKIIYFLRLYTDVVRAEGMIDAKNFPKAINMLRVVRNMTKDRPFKEEELYFKRLYSISNELIKDIEKCTKCKKKDCLSCDLDHTKTKLQLAQNICVLRIMKRA